MSSARMNAVVEVSEYTDYAGVTKVHPIDTVALTPSEHWVKVRVKAGVNGAAETVNLAQFAGGITLMMLQNLDSTDTVSVVFTTAAADTPTIVLPVSTAGVPLVTPDVDYSANITLESSGATNPVVEITILAT